MELLKDWGAAIAIALSLGTSIFAFLTRGSRVNSKAIVVLLEDIKKHNDRLLVIEGELKHRPTGEDFSDLKLSISELNGSMGVLTEKLIGMNNTLRLVNTEVLKRDKS